MKYFFSILSMCLLLACGQKTEGEGNEMPADTSGQEEIKDSAEVSQTDSIPPVEQPIVLNDVPKTKALEQLLEYFIEKYSVNYTEIHPEELKVHVLSRFGCEKKYAIYLQKKIPLQEKEGNIFPVAEIHAYVYKDSAQCANAVNNWLSCFGDNCEMVQRGQDATVNSAPGLYIINEKNIVCLDHKVLYQKNNWKNMYADLKKLFVSKRSAVIEVKNKGELVWVQKW